MLKRFVISPPFGNFLEHEIATSIKGSFTFDPRPGRLKALYTLRPYRDGWVNRFGLRNPGIRSIKFHPRHVYSIAAIRPWDWEFLAEVIPDTMMIEVNLSCPNVDHAGLPKNLDMFEKFPLVSYKVSPSADGIRHALELAEMGATHIHIGNTMPIYDHGVYRGGYSGPELRELVPLGLIAVRKSFPTIHLIAGGGVRTLIDVKRYRDVGADHVSISTAFMSPIRALCLMHRLREFRWN